MRRTICVTFTMLLLCGCAGASQGFDHFITRQGDRLMEGSKEYRFVSFNIPNLHYVEDYLPFEETNPWRLPDEFEITDALTAIQQMGGRATRIYTLSVRAAGDGPEIPRHVLGPGRFNEEAFRALDKVLEVAHRTGVRVIIPFVDNWIWWGGIQEYAAFRGKAKEAFWTDPQIIADFKKTIEYVVNRTNSYTGVKYRDDKAILAWETGNELQCPHEWTRQIAGYIKSLDQNHLVVDGFFSSVLRDESIDNPDVDIVTTHHYPSDPREMFEQVASNRARSKGRKPYFVGEFGFVETDAVRTLLDNVIADGTSGALIWSLRYRTREGGFYWHSEPFGGDRYKAYHWPGFASGEAYDERNLMALMRQKAFEIQGQMPPALAVPKAPVLLPIEDVAAISWQGSAGAQSYIVERAEKDNGPWTEIGRNVSDAAVPYRPLFADADVQIAGQYFYRVTAQNGTGVSAPSNTVGPVAVRHFTLVDEMRDFSLLYQHTDVTPETGKTRNAKEDMDRLQGATGAALVYRLPAVIGTCTVYTFFPEEPADFRFQVSADGQTWQAAEVRRKDFYGGEGQYGYWKPVRYEAKPQALQGRFIKIEFTGEAQISRIEITYGGDR